MADNVEAFLRDKLINSSPVTLIVTDRIYTVTADQDTDKPFIVCNATRTAAADTLADASDLFSYDAVIEYWADDFSEIKELEEAIRDTLNDYRDAQIRLCRFAEASWVEADEAIQGVQVLTIVAKI